MIARLASREDIPEILHIYNNGIDERTATFETSHKTVSDIEKWFDGIHAIVVVEQEGIIISFASSFSYSTRECYSGIAEFSVYVREEYRKQGAGNLALKGLIESCRDAGFWKLVSRIFPENHASRALMKKRGFREVGIYKKHSRLEGKWRDTVIVELLLNEITPES